MAESLSPTISAAYFPSPSPSPSPSSSSIDRLSDDELSNILRRVRGRVDRKACAQVCRRWLRLEGSTRLSLRILDPEWLSDFLPRFRFLVSLEASRGICNTDLSFIARTCPCLQSLNLSISKSRDLVILNFSEEYEYDAIGDEGISALSMGCKDLRYVYLRWRQGVGDAGVTALVRSCVNLVHLDLTRCSRVTDLGLQELAGASALEALVLKGCTKITDLGLQSLSSGKTASSLRKLDLSECDQVTDTGMTFLQQLCVLQCLFLLECGPRITDVGGVALSSLSTLRKLNLSWLINISDPTVLSIACNCQDLCELVLTGCELVSGVSVRRLSQHKNLQALVLAGCYNVFGDDVEEVALACSTLEYLGLDRGLRQWMSPESVKLIENRCRIEWI